MTEVRGKPAAGSPQRQTRTAPADRASLQLEGNILAALEKSYFKGRKLVGLKIREVEGNNVQGFLKISNAKGERQLVDFKATSTPHGGLAALEVDGRKIPILGISPSKRAHHI